MADALQNVRYDDRRSILVFADTADGMREGAALVEQVLAARTRTCSIADFASELDVAIAPGAVLVDVRGDGGEPLDRLLERLDFNARFGRFASVVCLPRALIDIVAARALHGRVELLVDAGEAERAIAIGVAEERTRTATLVAEERGQPTHLLQLSEEVGRIARTLAALSGAPEQRGRLTKPESAVPPPSAATVRVAIRARRLREQFFDGQLFADPAWDMLLDLFAARLEDRPVAVSSLCIAAAVPPTTALRWMKQLTDEGLFVRVADPRDGRRVFIELSDDTAAALSAYFQALGRMGLTLP